MVIKKLKNGKQMEKNGRGNNKHNLADSAAVVFVLARSMISDSSRSMAMSGVAHPFASCLFIQCLHAQLSWIFVFELLGGRRRLVVVISVVFVVVVVVAVAVIAFRPFAAFGRRVDGDQSARD